MQLIIYHNDIPTRVIVRQVSEKNAEAIRSGRKEAEDVADAMATALGVPLEEWAMCEDNELELDIPTTVFHEFNVCGHSPMAHTSDGCLDCAKELFTKLDF